jgi:hypothetical protein
MIRTRRRIRRQVKATSTVRQSSSLTEQRNILQARLRGWEEILPIYMPGLLQHRASFEADTLGPSSQSVAGAGHPENTTIWLPSQIPNHFRSRVCYQGLAAIEEKIRTASCYDSLDAIRNVLNVKSRLVYFKNKSSRGQREGNRSRTIIDRVHERARVAAERYRAARRGKLALAGAGDWGEVLRVLEDGDIRGYQDVDKLRTRVGRPGTLEDGQLAEMEVRTAAEQMGMAADDAEEQIGTAADGDDDDVASIDSPGINLFTEKRHKRDGTGQTRRTLSWIWTSGTRSPNPEDEGDDILQVEWAKSRARVGRCREEVLLLKEEMRRVVAFLNWKTTWWMDRQSMRGGVSDAVSKDLHEGLTAYAEGQADLQKGLCEHFCMLWKLPLGGNGDALHGGNGSDEEDGGDEEEDGDEAQGGDVSEEDEF